MLDQEVPDPLLGDGANLDELGGSVSDLTLGQGLQEGEVEVGVDGGKVGTWAAEANSALRQRDVSTVTEVTSAIGMRWQENSKTHRVGS